MSLAEFNIKIHQPKGLSSWRKLYLKFVEHIMPESITEVGSGSADFLIALPKKIKKTAIDGGERFKKDFLQAGIKFFCCDLDHDNLPKINKQALIICSDVFEHLLYPERTLKWIHYSLSPNGIFISHVPNEFVLKKTLRVMLGNAESNIYSHAHCSEYNHPHLHRFTDIGFKKFLDYKFKYNIKITELRYGKLPKTIKYIGFKVPYMFEMGPTYISTNNKEQYNKILSIKKKIKF